MCDVNWQLVLEYVKVFLSWPPIALLIALLFVARFRSAIDNFLARLVEGNIFGQVFKAVPPSQKVDPPGAAENRLAVAAEAAPHAEAVNQGAAEQLPPELAGDPLAPAAVAYVRSNPAQTVIEYKRVLFAYNSERLFTRIYGTQIALLEYLVGKQGVAVSLAELVKFHEEHQQKSGRTDYQIRDYINFLVSFGVVATPGPENAFEYRITQHGVEFLSYIKANYPADWNQRAF
ncbi:MAG: hypothetical protein ACXWIN_07485 [Burkholderiaceae bacterium]